MSTLRDEYEVLYGLLQGQTTEKQNQILDQVLTQEKGYWGILSRPDSKQTLFATPNLETYVRTTLSSLIEYNQSEGAQARFERVLKCINDSGRQDALRQAVLGVDSQLQNQVSFG